MNNYLFYGLVYFFMTFNADTPLRQEASALAKTAVVQSEATYFSDDLVYNDDLYTVLLRVDKQKKGGYLMSIQMQLKKDSYYVSPNATGDFSGKFTIVWENADFLNREQALIETPLSVEEFDPHPFVNGPVNWVRVNTSYKQLLQVRTTKDFDVTGYLQFTIEPRCSLEKLPFRFTFVNGKLQVKNDGC